MATRHTKKTLASDEGGEGGIKVHAVEGEAKKGSTSFTRSRESLEWVQTLPERSTRQDFCNRNRKKEKDDRGKRCRTAPTSKEMTVEEKRGG